MIRPLGDVLLVKLDPEIARGPLARVTPARVRTGVVLEVGPGRRSAHGGRIPIGVVPGERVAFFREHMDTRQGRALGAALAHVGEALVLLRVADVLLALGDPPPEVDA
jgi:co-chaperonin GroES (HSP10)